MWIWQHQQWPQLSWDESSLCSLLFQANIKSEQFLNKMKVLSKSYQLDAEAEILTEDSIHTSLIEGESLSRESVRASVLYHLGLEDRHLLDRHVDGLVQILLDARQNYSNPLSTQRLCSWHAALFPTGYSALHKITVGEYRNEGVRIVSGRYNRAQVHYEAPPAEMLNSQMNQFLNWFNQESLSLNKLIRAALAHLYFEIIHPFDDGNGRLGRAIIDLALAQAEQESLRFYSVSTAIEKNRKSYYAILETITKGDSLDVTEFLSWFMQLFIEVIDHSEIIISKVLRKAKFWQEHAQAELNSRQCKALNKMLDIDHFEGGMTTKKYMHLNKISRATAYRELIELVNKECLKPIDDKHGRSSGYELVI